MQTVTFLLQSLLYGCALVLAGGGAFELGRRIGEASLRRPAPPEETPRPISKEKGR